MKHRKKNDQVEKAMFGSSIWKLQSCRATACFCKKKKNLQMSFNVYHIKFAILTAFMHVAQWH
jgi:hypothetical protein